MDIALPAALKLVYVGNEDEIGTEGAAVLGS